MTCLVEMIHPTTRVHVDYYGKEGFILIGAFDRVSLKDFDHDELEKLGKKLNLEVTERWSGDSMEELVELVHNPEIKNIEGYVARFNNGLRVKFKFIDYLGRMIGEKLSYHYLMNRIINGNLEKMIAVMSGEVQMQARLMLEKIERTEALASDREKKDYLYNLVPPEESTQYYRGICRNYLKFLIAKNAK